MRWLSWTGGWVFLCSVAVLGLGACRSTGSGRSGPVVVYLVDTLRPDRMSAYGAALPTSPAAEALAREGLLYENAFAVSSWTRPSVATLLTSMLPARTATLGRWGVLDRAAWYLPEEFQRAGWKTAAFVGNGNLFDDRLGFERGFDVFRFVVHQPTLDWHPTAREVVDPALEYIASAASPKFFLYVHVVDPHLPYVLEQPWSGLFAGVSRTDARIPVDYDRSIRQADDHFQRIVDALRARGWWSEATAIYVSDHGEEFMEHGGTGHGHTVFEEQLRVPLIVKSPLLSGTGVRRSEPVTLADIAPTLATGYRLRRSEEWIGSDLASHLPPGRDLYFTEELDDNRLYGIRRGQQKLIVRVHPGFDRQLYSLDTDPGEMRGLPLDCNSTPPRLYGALAAWRERDVADFPGLLFERHPRRDGCRAVVDLSGVRLPFLTAEDRCRWSRDILASRLTVRDDPGAPLGQLRVAGDERGRPAPVSFSDDAPRCSVSMIASRLLQGEMSEDHLARLRALGYLGGP